MDTGAARATEDEALRFHQGGRPGKIDTRGVDGAYDGEMSADGALDQRLRRQPYPLCRLRGPANVLVMPALHSANIAAKLLPQLGGGAALLIGLSRPIEIVSMGATVSDLVNLAALAARDAIA